MEAFRWTSAAGMTGLGDLPGGDFYSKATDISADGSVVVGYGTSDLVSYSGWEAFYWTADNGMQNLKDVLTNCGLDLTGWRLQAASGVSADGLTIAGNGINPQGYDEAWIATVPEPATIAMLLIGSLALRRNKNK
jgi:uncharacterized membrane protein